MRGVASTHREGHNYSGLKPCARDRVEVTNLFEFKLAFDEKETAGRGRFEKVLYVPAGALSHAASVVSEEGFPVVNEGKEIFCGTNLDEGDRGNGHMIRVISTDRLAVARMIRQGPVIVFGCYSMLSMHRLLLWVVERSPPSMCWRVDQSSISGVAWSVTLMYLYSPTLARFKRPVT